MSELKAQGANETRFTYGASRSRVYRFSTDGTDDKTTYYLGLGKTNAPLYEVETNTTTNEETHLHFIYAGGYHGGHPFMMQVVKRNTINNEATYSGQEYMHRDHLWSVIAISDHTGRAISTTDPSKQYAYNKNYDAWGKRRNPDWTEGGDNQYTSDRGHLCYTGQESITNVGLIHMNGRVYDPELGRFISADPHIQFSADSQSYNRYSYVLNNPLKYTDPSGYFIRSFFQHIPAPLATVITVVLSIFGGSAGPAFAAIFAGFHGIANGADGNTVVLGAVLTVVGGQLGRGVATSANLVTTAGKLTLSGAMVAGAVAGAFSGGVNAAVAGTNIRRGVLQGLAIGAVSAAVVYGVRQSVGRRVTQKEPVDLDPRFMMAGGTDDDIRAGLAAKALLADQANQGRDTGLVAQGKAFGKGAVGWAKDVGRTVVTGASVACEGFSSTCANNVENSRRIGRAIHDYQNSPEIQQRVDQANKLATQVVMNDPVIQSQIAGRGTAAVIVQTLGPVGAGLNALAITGGALRASEMGGNVADMMRGTLGME